MRNLYRNSFILLLAGCFLAFNLIGETTADAQTRKSVVQTPTPTPAKKKSPVTDKSTPKPTPKTAAQPASKTTPKPTPTKTINNAAKTQNATTQKVKPTPTSKKPVTAKTEVTPKPTPRPASSEQIIITAAASRIRQQPKLNSPQLSFGKLGKTLPVFEKNAAWYQVEYETGKTGWISKTIARNYEAASRDEIYREIAEKYSRDKTLDLTTASEILEFLRVAQALVKGDELKADFALKRLRLLHTALKTIPLGKSQQSPYKAFLKANENEVVYSDPSGEWYVRSELFWELHSKNISLAVAEDIAWAAAQNPIPGECEGYVNCNLYHIRATDGEYLNFYPNGKYSRIALKNISDLLSVMVADVNNKAVFTPPSDISDRAEFNRFLTELRTIISKMPVVEKAKAIQQINRLGEGYK